MPRDSPADALAQTSLHSLRFFTISKSASHRRRRLAHCSPVEVVTLDNGEVIQNLAVNRHQRRPSRPPRAWYLAWTATSRLSSATQSPNSCVHGWSIWTAAGWSQAHRGTCRIATAVRKMRTSTRRPARDLDAATVRLPSASSRRMQATVARSRANRDSAQAKLLALEMPRLLTPQRALDVENERPVHERTRSRKYWRRTTRASLEAVGRHDRRAARSTSCRGRRPRQSARLVLADTSSLKAKIDEAPAGRR